MQILNPLPLETVGSGVDKIQPGESPRQLSRAVGSEVEKDARIAALNCRDLRTVVIDDNGRFDEFVCYAVFVCFAESDNRVTGFSANGIDTFGHGVVTELDAFPAAVAIHCVIPTGNCGDATDAKLAHFLDQFGDIILAGIWRCVSSVGDDVNKDAFDAAPRGQFQ